MIFIADQIIERLTSDLTFPSVTVKEAYNTSTVTAPMITIDERPGAPYALPDGKPTYQNLYYQIEVYTKALTLDWQVLSKSDANKVLLVQVANVLESVFGLTQAGEVTIAAYANDTNVARGVVRYRCIIDQTTETIYR